MTKRPNLFKFATSELSQDAFLCWLIQWADTNYKKFDPALHQAGMNFLKSISVKHEKNSQKDPLKEAISLEVEVRRQHKKIDVLALISKEEKKYVLVIEDKINSFMHSKQLSRYRRIAKDDFNDHDPLLVYFKTGGIQRAAKAENDGYIVYSRRDFLDVLKPYAEETKDSILRDYYQCLKSMDDDYQQYHTTPLKCWNQPNRAWEGFFGELRERMGREIGMNLVYWQFVNNPSGGETMFGISREVGEFQLHLQLVKKWGGNKRHFLAFRIGNVQKDRREVRGNFHRSFIRHAEISGWGGKFGRPKRWGNGGWMVIAESIEGSEWLPTIDGKIDINGTVEKLKGAYELLCDFEYEQS